MKDNEPKKIEIKFDVKNWVNENSTPIAEISENFKSYTILKLTGYRRERKGVQIDLGKAIEYLKSHLIPLIILNTNIKISIVYTEKLESYEISKDDIPKNMKEENISINNVTFNVRMAISESEKTRCEAHYIAGYRTAGAIAKVKPIVGYTLYCLVGSTFLDIHVNDSRDKIEFPTKNDGLFLSEEKIAATIYDTLQHYIQSEKPAIIDKNQNDKQKIMEDEPFLSDYIPDDPLLGKKDLRDSAHAEYQKSKEELRSIRAHLREQLESQNINDEEMDSYLNKAIEMGTKLLAEYVNDRHSIIEVLDKLDSTSEKVEKKWYNLFMPQKSEKYINSTEPYLQTKTNNLWLIDDRFMTYRYIASDIQISKILGKIAESDSSTSKDRPDLSIFISEKESTDKAVIIELKPYGISDMDKEKGVQQLLKYAEIFKEKLDSTQQWYYLITDIDEKFEKLLLRNEYQKVFTHGDLMYFNYNKNLDTHIYVLSYKSLIADAKVRNQIFLDQFIKQLPK